MVRTILLGGWRIHPGVPGCVRSREILFFPPLLSKDGALDAYRNFSGSTRERTPRAGLRQNKAGCSLTRQFVGGAVGVAEVLVGRRMIGKPLGFSVPFEISFSFQRNVPE